LNYGEQFHEKLNWIKFGCMLCTLMLLLSVFSRGDTNVNNNVDADETLNENFIQLN